MKRSTLISALLVVSGCGISHAQRCGATCASAESLLGLSEQALIAMIPELERSASPVPGPRKTIGKWVLTDMRFGTEPYVATYFVRGAKVRRIEYLSSATWMRCSQRIPLELAQAELRSQYGERQSSDEFESDGKTTMSAAFGSYAVVAAVYFSMTSETCTTRVVFRPRELKDATEL
jgi:hypothetical protein